MKTFKFFFFFFICLPIFSGHVPANAQSVQFTDFSSGFNWLITMEHANDDRIFALQKTGQIIIVNSDGSIEGTPFLDIGAKVDHDARNEKGLLGLAFHPDYETNRQFYVFYNSVPDGDVVVSQFMSDDDNPNLADPNSEVEIIRVPHPRGNHTGGCLKFGPDGYLYFGIGDGGGSNDPDKNGQDLTNLLGKLMRIDVDGRPPYQIPSDNPFIDDSNAENEIWAYGLRNPWRFSFDRLTGDLWIADVGQNEWEEINFQRASEEGGKNYGWSCQEGRDVFNAGECTPGTILRLPTFEYQHIGGSCSGSTSGGVVYRGMEFGDLWGKYLNIDFCTGRLYLVELIGGSYEGKLIGDFTNSEFTSLEENNMGEIFVTQFLSNEILKIESDDPTPTAVILNDDIELCEGNTATLTAYSVNGSPMQYQWQKDGLDISGANNSTLTVSEPGFYEVKVTNPANNAEGISGRVTVTIVADYDISMTQLAMAGDTVGGVVVTADTTFSMMFTSSGGCDSMVTYNVIVPFSSTNDFFLSENDFTITPNPTQGYLQVELNLLQPIEISLSLNDLHGKVVAQPLLLNRMNEGSHQVELDISHLPRGIYFLSAQTERGVVTKRVLKI